MCENYYGDIKNQYWEQLFCHFQKHWGIDKEKYTNFNYFQIIYKYSFPFDWTYAMSIRTERDLHIPIPADASYLSVRCCYYYFLFFALCKHLEIESTLYPLITFMSSSFLNDDGETHTYPHGKMNELLLWLQETSSENDDDGSANVMQWILYGNEREMKKNVAGLESKL